MHESVCVCGLNNIDIRSNVSFLITNLSFVSEGTHNTNITPADGDDITTTTTPTTTDSSLCDLIRFETETLTHSPFLRSFIHSLTGLFFVR